jgi:hypothetical protein
MKKKVKKYAGGGLSGIASEATSLMGAVDSAANAINSIKSGSGGGQGPIGGSGALGFLNNSNPAQGLRSNPDMYNQLLTQTKNFTDFRNKTLADMAGNKQPTQLRKGGSVKSSASKRADGCASKGKTRGRMV